MSISAVSSGTRVWLTELVCRLFRINLEYDNKNTGLTCSCLEIKSTAMKDYGQLVWAVVLIVGRWPGNKEQACMSGFGVQYFSYI